MVTENCIRCKFTDCIEVCPVDCSYEGENMLVINRDQRIDCGVCKPACLAQAIKSDTESNLERWLEINGKYLQLWPNITGKRESEDVNEFDGAPNKFETYFSPLPGRR